MAESPAASEAVQRGSPWEVLLIALRLGLTSFGGPVAHLGYFRQEYVERRRWLDDRTYLDIVALSQFLPGPASSQVGIAIGQLRAGWLGAVLAWFGFTLPSTVVMVLFAYGVATWDVEGAGWLHGLKVVAVAVVANAVWGMARTLANDRITAMIAVASAALVLAWPSSVTQVGAIVAGALLGWRLLAAGRSLEAAPPTRRGRRWAIVALVLFVVLLVALPLARRASDSHALAMADAYYRVGSLVFGGGHVVLPLLESEVVPPGWMTQDRFIAGYGAAQAVPGPLMSFAAYLGAAQGPTPNGWIGGALALVAIYVPSFLLVWGALPFWDRLRNREGAQSALRGVGAAVVGILLAALYDPVWTSVILAAEDFALALVCFALLVVWRLPPWSVVLFAAAGGEALARL